MNETELALAKRAVAAGWRWAPGHVDSDGWRVVAVMGQAVLAIDAHSRVPHIAILSNGAIPDFSDKVTRSSAILQVRDKHWAKACASDTTMGPVDERWSCYYQTGNLYTSGSTELGSIIAALETER